MQATRKEPGKANKLPIGDCGRESEIAEKSSLIAPQVENYYNLANIVPMGECRIIIVLMTERRMPE
jgi:hypothetical protein